MRWRRAVAVAALALAAAVAIWALRAGEGPMGDAELSAVVPADARAVLWLDDLDGLFAALDRVAARLDGADGIPKALALALGLEQPTSGALTAAGVAPKAGAALFLWRGAAWGCVAASSRRGVAHVRTWLGQRGLVLVAVSADPASAAPRSSADDGQQAWRVMARAGQGDGVAKQVAVAHLWRHGPWLLFRAPLPKRWSQLVGRDPGQKAGSAAADHGAWAQAAKQAPKGSTGEVHLRASLGQRDGLRPALRSALGLGSLVFGGIVDGVQGIVADLALGGAAVRLRLNLPTVAKGNTEVARYHDGFLAEGSAPLDLGGVLPDEVALWARAHLNPRLLDMIPSFLRDRVLPRTLLRRLHPALAKVDARALLIDRLEGRFAVGLLGIDDKAPLDPRVWRRVGLQRSLGGFVAGTLHAAADAKALQTALRSALAGGGEQLKDAALGAWRGWRGRMMGTEVSLLRRDNALLLIAGKTEFSRFERVARGRFPSLGRAAVTPLERAMANDSVGWIGLGCTTGRIARAARRRGVPDAFVRMVRGVAAITVGVRLTPDGIASTTELRPRRAAVSGKDAPGRKP